MKRVVVICMLLISVAFAMGGKPVEDESKKHWLKFYDTVSVVQQQGVAESKILECSINGMLDSLGSDNVTYDKNSFSINGKEFSYTTKERSWDDFYMVMDSILRNIEEGSVSVSVLADGATIGAQNALYDN